MADTYLERHREDYERRKKMLNYGGCSKSRQAKRFVEKPEDESL